MIVRKCSGLLSLYAAIREANEKYKGNLMFVYEPKSVGSGWRFRLRVWNSRGPGHRRTVPRIGKSRRLVAACWHAHRDFMWSLFKREPNATLTTKLARYEGKEGFLAKFFATGCANIGSQAFPCWMKNACDCFGE